MIGLIVTGHGNFATGLLSALDLIAGKQEKLKAVDFKVEDSIEVLEKNLRKAEMDLGECEGILYLTDLAGGSPFKAAVLLSENKNSKVIAGANLGMLLEISLCRGSANLKELKKNALEAGKNAIVAYEGINKHKTITTGI